MEKIKLDKEFWVIEVTTKKGEIGFAIKATDGKLMFAIGGFDVKTTIFKSRSDANECINKHKLYKFGGVRIVSGNEIAEKYGTKSDVKKDLWYIVNQDGLYLKYSAEKNVGYYFAEEMLGACMFDDFLHLGKFIECWQPQFSVSELIPKLMEKPKI